MLYPDPGFPMYAIRYGPEHASVLDVDGMAELTILLDGCSKTSAFSQYAAIAALEGPWEPVDQMVAEFRAGTSSSRA